ncbi:hypothetical protein SAICODRAFT_19735 [Saitoella complicata NRRL Y-17804]|nr:uncharacterized protein SAICODRAFT_19735 [Saitoella complicata NRRL Y-17804]ODQ52556.1 hypothetical protein SAICODRAFT_19735 [Saitoella complicata NRRL Y-17804]
MILRRPLTLTFLLVCLAFLHVSAQLFPEPTSTTTGSGSAESGSSARASSGVSNSAAFTSDSPTSDVSQSTPASNDATTTRTGPISKSTVKHTDTTTTADSTGSISIDPRFAPGSAAMLIPAPTDGPQYYMIGDYVTLAWNYTGVLVTPRAVNVEAYCSVNSYYYPIATNISYTSTSIIWDSSENPSADPLLQASYTLNIFDADSNPTAAPSAGYLYNYGVYRFGMYSGQAYEAAPTTGNLCPTCGIGAGSTVKVSLCVIALSVFIGVIGVMGMV